jgi:integrase
LRVFLCGCIVGTVDSWEDKTVLTQAAVSELTTPGKHRIDRGLYLQIAGPNARSWLFRYQFQGKPRWLGLGSAADVTLRQALAARDDAKAQLRRLVDPVADRKQQKLQVRTQARNTVTFAVRAEEYLHAHEDNWRNARHRVQWRSSLRLYVLPKIGSLPAATIAAADIVDLLRPMWATKQQTARRVRGRIEAILDYAADPDDHAWRNPAAAAERLLKALPKVKHTVKSHAALPYTQVAAFVRDLRKGKGPAAAALEFVILTACRTSEALGATWDEIDTPQRLWCLPAARTKGGREHRVPLSGPALAVLDRVRNWQQGEHVFPSLPHDRPLSHTAMRSVLQRLSRHDITVHGFRSTFRDWVAEQTNFQGEVAEMALAHRRGDLFEKRRALMEAWGKYCTTPLRGKR